MSEASEPCALPAPGTPVRWSPRVGILLLLIATALVYLPTLSFDYVHWDDDLYVYENPHVTRPLSWESFRWAWQDRSPYFMPLSSLSFMADVALFGLNPAAAHLHNLLLHLINVLLLYTLLNRTTRAPGKALLVAGLFALHPLHVEAVVWISERKEVLSTLFALLSLLFYHRYTEARSPSGTPDVPRKFYLLALVCFVASMLSKPIWVTLPALLLLLDWWPLGRYPATGFWRLCWEKIPFGIISLVFTLAIYTSYHTRSLLLTFEAVPPLLRVANLFTAYQSILLKTLVPVGLSPVYGPPVDEINGSELASSLTLLTILTLLAIHLIRSRPYLIMGWLWFLGSYLPVSGLINSGMLVPWADRWTYLPHIGLFAALVWGTASLPREGFWRVRPPLLLAAGLTLLTAMAALTWQQSKTWTNTDTLWQRVLEISPTNYHAHWAYGVYLGKKQPHRLEEAFTHLNEALRLVPRAPQYAREVGTILLMMGHLPEALMAYNLVWHNPLSSPMQLTQVGLILMGVGDFPKATTFLRRGLLRARTWPPDTLDVDVREIHFYLGLSLQAQDQDAEAHTHFVAMASGGPAKNAPQCQKALAFLQAAPGRVLTFPRVLPLLQQLCDDPQKASQPARILVKTKWS